MKKKKNKPESNVPEKEIIIETLIYDFIDYFEYKSVEEGISNLLKELTKNKKNYEWISVDFVIERYGDDRDYYVRGQRYITEEELEQRRLRIIEAELAQEAREIQQKHAKIELYYKLKKELGL